MICRVGQDRLAGRAVDLPRWLDPAVVATAIREDPVEVDGTTVAVLARTPGPLHERVGCIREGKSLRPRTALAQAARSRGWTTPVDGRLAAARERLADHEAERDSPALDPREHRRRLAETGSEVDHLRERVAEARGRVQTAGGRADQPATDGAGAGDDLEAAVRELSEVETAAAAAREDHRKARAAARDRRDRLQERLRLVDEVANFEREARAHLVDAARPAYECALGAVPGAPVPSDPFEAPPDAMALAIARVGALAAPVVVASDRFGCAAAAARWLRAPAIRLSP